MPGAPSGCDGDLLHRCNLLGLPWLKPAMKIISLRQDCFCYRSCTLDIQHDTCTLHLSRTVLYQLYVVLTFTHILSLYSWCLTCHCDLHHKIRSSFGKKIESESQRSTGRLSNVYISLNDIGPRAI